MRILGIETSCDETAAAIVDSDRQIQSNVVYSQIDQHFPYGGVVPEIAARAHLETLPDIIRRALYEAEVTLEQVDAVAATGGPGLIGGLIVGTMAAKSIASVRNIPFIPVNHLEAHALTVRMSDDVAFPYLLLLVSGGHCQILSVAGPGSYKLIGQTLDDAVGEAFDKTARLLGLGFPGGPAVEAAAAAGDPERFDLPRPMKGREGCDFSYSGLKTAVRHVVARLPGGQPTAKDRADICASFQTAVADTVADRCANAIEIMAGNHRSRGRDWPLVVSGGVAANTLLRERLSALCHTKGVKMVAPPPDLCTDNGAMIAWAGIERMTTGVSDQMGFSPRPRWPLEALS